MRREGTGEKLQRLQRIADDPMTLTLYLVTLGCVIGTVCLYLLGWFIFHSQRYPNMEGKSHLSLVIGRQSHMETKTPINFHQVLELMVSNTHLSFLVIRLVF